MCLCPICSHLVFAAEGTAEVEVFASVLEALYGYFADTVFQAFAD